MSDADKRLGPPADFPDEVFLWLEGDRSPAVTAVVERWIHGEARAPASLQELQEIWDAMGLAPAESAWEDLKARIDEGAGQAEIRVVGRPAAQGRRHHPGRWAPLRIAAMLILGIGLGTLWQEFRHLESPAELTRVVVPAGSRTDLVLPGGISVHLGYASELSYAPSPNVREVHLEGEAYFSVPDGASENLVVRTEAGTIYDLGTEFNVRARSGKTSVIVTEGLVRLEGAGEGVTLEAGEGSSIQIGGGPEPARAIDPMSALHWSTGRLTFIDTAISDVIGELGLRYDLHFSVDPKLARDRITTTILPETTVEEAMLAICASVDARCTRTNGGWQIAR